MGLRNSGVGIIRASDGAVEVRLTLNLRRWTSCFVNPCSSLCQSTISLENTFRLLAQSRRARKNAVWKEGEVANIYQTPTCYRTEGWSCRTIPGASHLIFAKIITGKSSQEISNILSDGSAILLCTKDIYVCPFFSWNDEKQSPCMF